MLVRKTTAVATVALAIGVALTGCTTPAAENTPTPSPSSTRTASATPSSPSTPTPPPTAAPVEWTAAQLTQACVEYQAGWAESEGYAPDDFEWVTPATTQQNSGTWFVFLQGTFTTPGGDAVPAEYSCAVTGTPDAPVVTETASE